MTGLAGYDAWKCDADAAYRDGDEPEDDVMDEDTEQLLDMLALAALLEMPK